MRECGFFLLKDLPENDQECIFQELRDEEDGENEITQFLNVPIYLYEYDPNNKEDFDILNYFLKEKVSNEGEPDQDSVKGIIDNCHVLINNPIIIIDGFAKEGRHRLAASLNSMKPIRGWCL